MINFLINRMNKIFLASILALFVSTFSYAQFSMSRIDTLYFEGESGYTDRENSVAYTDFNGDNLVDFIYIRQYGIYVRYGLGNTLFDEEVTLYSWNKPIRGVSNLKDINADGFLDIAVAIYNSNGSTIEILTGSVDGFQLLNEFGMQSMSWSEMLWKDWDEDGSQDLIFQEYQRLGYVSNWNEQDINFNTLIESQEIHLNFHVEDFNRDGLEDLVIGHPSKNIIYLQNTLNGFKTIQTADLSGDGYADIVFDHNEQVYLYTFDSQSSTFNETILPNHLNRSYVRGLGLIDWDNNNTIDIIYGATMGGVDAMLNSGGEFNTTVEITDYSQLYFTTEHFYLDLDNDNDKDLIVHGFDSRQVFNLSAQRTIDSTYADQVYESTKDMVIEDIDKDGFNDLLLVKEMGVYEIFYGDQSGYSTSVKYSGFYEAQLGQVLDVNNDGINDLLVTQETKNNGVNAIFVAYGQGARNFADFEMYRSFPNPTKLIPYQPTATSEMTWCVYPRFGNEIIFLDPISTEVDEYYLSPTKVELVNGQEISSMNIVDLNKDGSNDILTANKLSQNISILTSTGEYTFSESTIDVGKEVHGVIALDFNGDGFNDVLASGIDQNTYLDIYQPMNFDHIDLDLDGDKDLILSGWDYTGSAIFLNENTEFVLSSIEFENTGQSFGAVTDFNIDGRLDFLKTTFTGRNIFVFLNNSVVEPNLGQHILEVDTSTSHTVSLNLKDLHTDGTLVIVKPGESTVSIPPTDNFYYSQNLTYSIGSPYEEGYVVYAGNDSLITIEGLNPASTYTIFSYPYYKNAPQNTLVNYTTQAAELTFETASSLYWISELDTIKISEDSVITLNLDEHINNYGENQFAASASTEGSVFGFSEGILTFTPPENYFGYLDIDLEVSTPYERDTFAIHFDISPIDDPIELAVPADSVVGELTNVSYSIAFIDVDDDTDSVTVSVTSSNSDISVSNVRIENGQVVFDLTPLDFGFAIITIELINGDDIQQFEFTFEASSVLSLNDALTVTSFEVYPNPVSHTLFLESLNNNDEPIKIMNSSGRLIQSFKPRTKSIEINTSHLENGTYIILQGFDRKLILVNH